MTPGILLFLYFKKQCLLTNSANVLRNLDDAIPNERDVKTFLRLSVSRSDGSDPLYVSIAAFKSIHIFIYYLVKKFCRSLQ